MTFNRKLANYMVRYKLEALIGFHSNVIISPVLTHFYLN